MYTISMCNRKRIKNCLTFKNSYIMQRLNVLIKTKLNYCRSPRSDRRGSPRGTKPPPPRTRTPCVGWRSPPSRAAGPLCVSPRATTRPRASAPANLNLICRVIARRPLRRWKNGEADRRAPRTDPRTGCSRPGRQTSRRTNTLPPPSGKK